MHCTGPFLFSFSFNADHSRTKEQQAERREQRAKFEAKRVQSSLNNVSLAQLEEVVAQRKKDEEAAAKKNT